MFAASQGGHYKELMGLQSLFSKYDSVLVTDNQAAIKQVDVASDFKDIAILHTMADARKKMAGSSKRIGRFQQIGTYLKMFIECIHVYQKYKPKVIVSTGANIAVPLFICAKLYGAKSIFVESNAMVYSKTTTGTLVEKLSDTIYVQWPEMLKVYPNAEYYGVLN